MSEGYLSVTNHSGGTLTIESVTLAAPRNIRLIGAFIVPLRRNVIGDTDGWPPPRHLLLPGVEWAKRHVPAGARVRPGEWVDPVIGLRIAPGHDKGSEDGMLIRYQDAAGQQYVLHTAIDATLQTGPKACPA